MADLERFREQVTIFRKRKRNADGKQYTLEALADRLGLSADEVGHRLRGTGRSKLTQKDVLAIVRTLAEWETLTWEEAKELLVCMEYPLDPPDWQTELQRFLGPPPQSVHQTIASRVALAGEVPSSPVRRRLFSPDLVSDEDLDKEVIILIKGSDVFGNQIYTYLQILGRDLKKMFAHIQAGKNIKLADFGTILTSGIGEVPQEIYDKMKKEYNMIDIPNA